MAIPHHLTRDKSELQVNTNEVKMPLFIECWRAVKRQKQDGVILEVI